MAMPRKGMSELIALRTAMTVENGRSLVDENSQQPTAVRAFTIERWWIARCGEPTVPYSKVGLLRAAEHAARCEVK
jgi:hypothetical protein